MMAPEYGVYSKGVLFSSAFNTNVTPIRASSALPSYPTSLQGDCLMDCPFIAALASIAWVNRNFIINNITTGSGTGKYTIYFWDYPGVSATSQVKLSASGAACQINSSTITPVKTAVTVSQKIPLDSSGRAVDPATGLAYGAGSSNNVSGSASYEIWPALYEKAYAKFLLYKKGSLSAGDLTNPDKDPSFSQLMNFTQTDWGGNAAYVLQWLTGLNTWAYTLSSKAFSPVGGASGTATGSIYSFIKTGFCQSASPYGLGKTKYPLVAWTYADGGQPSGVPYSASGILANHCYSVLGTLDVSGLHYIILGTTFGLTNPSPGIPSPNPLGLAAFAEPATYSPWSCYDALFRMTTIAGATAFPKTSATVPNKAVLNLSNGIFGVEASTLCTNSLTTFQNYFASVGWVQGY